MTRSSSAPFFSIIIPTFNRSHEVRRVVAQLVQQTYIDFEAIVIDDGSTDDTEAYFLQTIDNRVKYFKIENKERGYARNFGAEMASGSYLNFFDSDDEMLNCHLETAFKNLIDDCPPLLCLGYMNRDNDGTLSAPSIESLSVKKLLFDNFISINSVFLRSDIFAEYKFCEDRRLASSEDWELWIRLSVRFPFKFSSDVTSYVVSHLNRSLVTLEPRRIEERDKFLIERLRLDCKVMTHFGLRFRRFVAERYTFFMLRYSEVGKIWQVFKYALASIFYWPSIVTSRRYIASLRNILFGKIC